MSIIEEDVRRLDRLISDISDASRLDAELSRAEMGPVDLGRMLSTLVDVQETTAGRADKPLLRLDQRGDLKINGMERRLAQVFENIIANASSFTRPGGAISIKARAKDGWLKVTTDDDGPGIPEDQRADAFATPNGGIPLDRDAINAILFFCIAIPYVISYIKFKP